MIVDRKEALMGFKTAAGASRCITCSALFIAIVGGLSGCVATTPIQLGAYGGANSGMTNASYTPAEQKLRQDSQLFGKTSMQGCLAGAAAGALIGMLASRDRGRGAAIGALGGCAAGFAVNAYVQQKRGQYQNNEARINAMIADVRSDNQKLAAMVSTTRAVIAEDKRRIASVNTRYLNEQISADQARAELARVKENRALLDNSIKNVKKREQDWTEIAALERKTGADTSGLDAEIRQLRKKADTLQAEAALIDREIAASPVAA
jgi:hypothetical protein